MDDSELNMASEQTLCVLCGLLVIHALNWKGGVTMDGKYNGQRHN